MSNFDVVFMLFVWSGQALQLVHTFLFFINGFAFIILRQKESTRKRKRAEMESAESRVKGRSVEENIERRARRE